MWDQNTIRELNERLVAEDTPWHAETIIVNLDPLTGEVREVYAKLYSNTTREYCGREILETHQSFCSNCCQWGHRFYRADGTRECTNYDEFGLTLNDEMFLRNMGIKI